MRVLLVTEDVPALQIGGLGKHVIRLGNALRAAGHAVTLLGRRGVRDVADADIGFDGELMPAFDFEGIGWKETQLGVWLPWKRLVVARRIEAAIAAQMKNFDVVHYHGHLPMVGLGLPAALNLVQTRHDQGSECITHLRFRDGRPCGALAAEACAGCAHASPGTLRRTVSAAAVSQYRQATARNFAQRKTIFVSDFLRRQFLRTLPQADLRRARVIHNFIDLQQLHSAAAAAPGVREGSVLLVGRLDEAKGFGAFLDALVPRLAAGQEVCVVGDGPQRDALQRRHGGATVRFLGWRDNAEVLALTAAAHVCVTPSVLEESCATTILEPLVLGRPVLALRRGGTPELARYQRHEGQLTLADDTDALAVATIGRLSRSAAALPPPETSGADIRSVLPQIVEVYADEAAATVAQDRPLR